VNVIVDVGHDVPVPLRTWRCSPEDWGVANDVEDESQGDPEG
jgi:hypothetical protein